MSKTYAVTGWRVGTMIAPPHLTHAFRQVHDFVSIGAAAPLQEAGAFAYRMPRDYYDRLAADYQARRDRLCGALIEIGFDLEPPQGAYYVMADITAFGATDDVAFARYLVRDIGVATVPGSSFFHDKELGRRVHPLLLLQTGRDLTHGHRAATQVAGHRMTLNGRSRALSRGPGAIEVPRGGDCSAADRCCGKPRSAARASGSRSGSGRRARCRPSCGAGPTSGRPRPWG